MIKELAQFLTSKFYLQSTEPKPVSAALSWSLNEKQYSFLFHQKNSLSYVLNMYLITINNYCMINATLEEMNKNNLNDP